MSQGSSAQGRFSVPEDWPEPWPEEDRHRLLARLQAFVEQPRNAAFVKEALALFWSAAPEELTEEQFQELWATETVQVNFHAFLLFDVTFRKGRTLAREFLERKGMGLPVAQRRFLEALLAARLGVWEVAEVRPGKGLLLRGLWLPGEYWVRERTASRMLHRWDILVARLLELPDGTAWFANTLFPFPASARAEVLEELEEIHKSASQEVGEVSPESALSLAIPLVHGLWVDLQLPHRRPVVTTREGKPVTPTEVVWEVLDRAAVEQVLKSGNELLERVVGVAWTEAGNLVLTALTEEDARFARVFLGQACGHALRFREMHQFTPEEMRRAARRAAGSPAPAKLPAGVPSVYDHIEARELHRHYRSWPDLPVPALGDVTPREAAADERLRGRLVSLLKEMENRTARGGPGYDFTWLWRELGLEAPGRPAPATPGPHEDIPAGHLLWPGGFEAPSRALRLWRDRLGIMATAVTFYAMQEGSAPDQEEACALRCWRRPGGRPCPGRILVRLVRQGGGEDMQWRCLVCGASGSLQAVTGTPWDIRRWQRHPEREPGSWQLRLPPSLWRDLYRSPVLGARLHGVLLQARPDDRGLAIAGTREDLEDFVPTALAEGDPDLLDVLASLVDEGRE